MLPWRLDGSLCAFGRFSIMRTHIADKQQNNSPPGSEVLKKLILHETSISAGWQKSWLKMKVWERGNIKQPDRIYRSWSNYLYPVQASAKRKLYFRQDFDRRGNRLIDHTCCCRKAWSSVGSGSGSGHWGASTAMKSGFATWVLIWSTLRLSVREGDIFTIA